MFVVTDRCFCIERLLQLWPNLATFCRFGNILKVLGNFYWLLLEFVKIKNLFWHIWLLGKLYCCKWPNFYQLISDIRSHWLIRFWPRMLALCNVVYNCVLIKQIDGIWTGDFGIGNNHSVIATCHSFRLSLVFSQISISFCFYNFLRCWDRTRGSSNYKCLWAGGLRRSAIQHSL